MSQKCAQPENQDGAPEQSPLSVLRDADGRSLTLRAVFAQACAVMPELAGGRVLGSGAFGIVVDNGDDTVTKITFRDKSAQRNANSTKIADAEVAVLRLLRDHCAGGKMGDFDVPVLLGEPQEMPENSLFLGAFRMTRVPGATREWYGAQGYDPQTAQAHFFKAGEAMALFHDLAQDMPFAQTARDSTWTGDNIAPLPHLSAHINKGLEATSRYLRAHAVPGVIHGDFHGGNLMTAADGRVTGLVDLGMVGQARNMFADFLAVPEPYLVFFTAGYEAAGGRPVDRHVITASSLGWMTEMARHTAHDPAMLTEAVLRINRTLNNLTFVTGHKP